MLIAQMISQWSVDGKLEDEKPLQANLSWLTFNISTRAVSPECLDQHFFFQKMFVLFVNLGCFLVFYLYWERVDETAVRTNLCTNPQTNPRLRILSVLLIILARSDVVNSSSVVTPNEKTSACFSYQPTGLPWPRGCVKSPVQKHSKTFLTAR